MPHLRNSRPAMPRACRAAPLLLAVGSLLPLATAPAVELASVFQDHMVLQSGRPVALWGRGTAGEHVSLAFSGRSAETTVGADGRWHAALPALAADAAPHELVVNGAAAVVLHDVLVGEVWICAGQSNMGTRVKDLPPDMLAEELPRLELPTVRYFNGENPFGKGRQSDFSKGAWTACSAASASDFSGVATFFARELQHRLNVPIGIVHVAVGGSASEAWTSPAGLAGDPAYTTTLKPRWEKLLANYPAAKKRYDEVTIPRWQEAVAKAKADGKEPPKKPGGPWGIGNRSPSTLFDALVAPLIGLEVRGVAWYQGESNADKLQDALDYRTLFPTLIRDWRTQWQRDDLPFVFVQLANFKAVQSEPVEPEAPWPFAREAQDQALALPFTAMATAIDVNSEPDNIHPRDKRTVGQRLGWTALAAVYRQDLPWSGPRFQRAEAEGQAIRLHFAHAEGGLHAGRDVPSAKLTGFAIAAASGPFVWADARIDGDTVVVSNATIAAPTRVRYDWAQNPLGNLYNGAQLPAFPFRTDRDADPVVH